MEDVESSRARLDSGVASSNSSSGLLEQTGAATSSGAPGATGTGCYTGVG